MKRLCAAFEIVGVQELHRALDCTASRGRGDRALTDGALAMSTMSAPRDTCPVTAKRILAQCAGILAERDRVAVPSSPTSA